ncbi:hypothetical protein BS78_01G144000 [Paspalum vaginatum]|nr:hypothetical protein BS78_01G144000 [Paspalum vaginatum]
MLPRRQRRAIARASVSALLAALPLLYVSLRRPPPAALAGDTAFWFLTSNCVVAAIDDGGGEDAGLATAAGAEGGGGAVPVVVPLAVVRAAGDDAAANFVSAEGGGGRVQEVVASTVDTGGNDSVEDLLLNHTRIQQGEEDEVATIGEPGADMHNAAAAAATTMVNGQGGGEGEIYSPATLAFDETAAVPAGKLGTIKVDGEALLLSAKPEPEPWAPTKLVTSKSVPDEEHAADDDEDWGPPNVALAQDNNKGGVAAARDGRIRRTATEGRSKQAAADSSEYWELSDEELNRRVENFIARFNREMRLQMEQELAAYAL